MGVLSDSISTDVTKSGAQVQFTVSFNVSLINNFVSDDSILNILCMREWHGLCCALEE